MQPPQMPHLNDLKTTRSPDSVSTTIHDHSKLTLSFFSLLLGSTIICTLGLLMNNPSIVIGGMIISPLMWPILSVAIGISFSQNKNIKRSLLIFLVAVLAAFVSATIVTFISPIKLINSEILARIEPTFLDVVVACVAGFIAALGVSHQRISSSLAGVALATSLLPPLCVSAIGLALLDMQIFSGALLLFSANVASILFVTIVTFSIIGLKKKRFSELRLKAMLVTVTILIIIANPLLTILEHQSFEILAYPKAKNILETRFKSYSPSINVDTIEIVTQKNGSLLIEAVIWLPSDLTISYVQQKELVTTLETALNKPINLKLKLQRTISILSEADERKALIKSKLTDIFYQNLSRLPRVSIDSLELIEDDSEVWRIQAVIRSDSSNNVPENLPDIIKQQVLSELHLTVTVQIEVMPRKTLTTQEDQ
ncbi:DUF389 domain-containing protein [Patescibacteria group bacterium]|nr:DUF389 domain-containing protein [Patescibacteria group bacterium]